MNLAVTFKNSRLHVGHRRRDWSDVWYEPIMSVQPDEDGAAPAALFRDAKGIKTREPMDGEVHWHPHFDIVNCEASSKPQRLRMQLQFLFDAHRYCKEKDPGRIADMEQELDQPGFMRWQSWFHHAKKWKNKQLKEQKARDARNQKKLEQKALELGCSIDEVSISSESDDDSAYGGDDINPINPIKPMGPPPTPPGSGLKRDGLPKKPKPGSKKPKQSTHNNNSHTYMSGALRSYGMNLDDDTDSSGGGDEDKYERRVRKLNGGLDEEEALDQARRESETPQPPTGL